MVEDNNELESSQDTPDHSDEPAGPTSTGSEETKKPAKKPTSGRKPAKKATSGQKAAKKAISSSTVAKYPRHTVEQALRIPEAILQQNGGNPASPSEAVNFSGGAKLTGPWRVEISSAKKYGFLGSVGANLVVEDRARRAISPQDEHDRRNALREAVLSAPDLSDVYNFYRGGSLPDHPFLVNALTDRFEIPPDKVAEFLDIFLKSMRAAELLDESGNQAILLDAGRELSKSATSTATTKKVVKTASSDATCFVMQPFAEPLGGYYDLVFKPAIEQAGLTPVRADAEIFGTGKIIDQIWRGIQEADVLVAELTSKNANVFYELGLAHASAKPVILVSSNEDDVPFDLRHIRVILYDRSDPFWGQKLIDNIADKITSALERPEEATFRFDAGGVTG
jgi:hypothetical protein